MQVIQILLPNTSVLIATVLRWQPDFTQGPKTEFVTDRSQSIQVGVLHRKAGTSVEAHQHLPVQKTVSGCQEILIVRSGQILVDIFSPEDSRAFVQSLILKTGDIYIQYCGGHAFHFQTDVDFVEIKQGPYTPADKVFFDPRCHENMK